MAGEESYLDAALWDQGGNKEVDFWSLKQENQLNPECDGDCLCPLLRPVMLYQGLDAQVKRPGRTNRQIRDRQGSPFPAVLPFPSPLPFSLLRILLHLSHHLHLMKDQQRANFKKGS